MRLKTQLVLAITSLVFLTAGLLSLVYIGQLVTASVHQSYDNNLLVARQIRFALQRALENGLKNQTIDPLHPEELRKLAADAVRDNDALNAVVDSVNRYSPTVYDIHIADNDSRVILTTAPEDLNKPLPMRPNYALLRDANTWHLLRSVTGKPQVYDIALSLDRNGLPFASVHVGIRNTLLRAVYEPYLKSTVTLMCFVLGTALVAAFLLGNLALRPIEQISQQLDYLQLDSLSSSSKENEPESDAFDELDEPDAAKRVTSKIQRIGQRIRNVEEVFSALKENLDHMLGNLQDGILLFTPNGHAVIVSDAASRYLNMERNSLLGRHASEIFDRATTFGGTVLGAMLRDAFDKHRPISQEEVSTESGRRIEVSLDFIHDATQKDRSRQDLGALLTLHDSESVEEIGSELELSRRMAAIGRLTSGVGHEVKNPINAIVVHIELLKNKLGTQLSGSTDAPARRHLDVIESEIHRLDRVVQMLVDFSRPVELRLYEQDLRPILEDVLLLASAELETRQVTIESSLPDHSVIAKVDTDLLKQALINVIENGAQAMPQGGHLTVGLDEDRRMAILRIRDEGIGIPEEILERIFNLYFTTKSNGSGIGLAMTYRILQLHHGSIDVQSEVGRGTEFLLRIPLVSTDRARQHTRPVENIA